MFFLAVSAPATPGQDLSVRVSAQVQESPQQIQLNWPVMGGPGVVSRRLLGQTGDTWTQLATNLNAATISYTDTNVVPGTTYEYWIRKSAGTAADGYVCGSIYGPATERRGKVLLVVDDVAHSNLTFELTRLQRDLAGDGWTVVYQTVPRDAPVTNVKQLIKAGYDADPTNVKALFLLGHVPVPYSGTFPNDGHHTHSGAWPADTYYGDMDGAWTDTTVSNAASSARQKNVPGDGKFDQDQIPSFLELEVGRVDLYDMPAFSLGETGLLRQYLDKDHNFRHGLVRAEARGLIADTLAGAGPSFTYSASGWRNFSALLGASNVVGESWSTTYIESRLWAYGCGWGTFTSANDIGTTADFAEKDPRAVFVMLLGSYFGDWDVQNNFLRAPLATKSYGLTSCWAGIPDWYVHHMGTGATIGYSTMRTQNGVWPDYGRGTWPGGRHIALMGDPTLRLHAVAPPSQLGAEVTGTTNVALSWTESSDNSILGYHVYRARSMVGPFARLSPSLIAGTNYTDSLERTNDVIYMVRGIALEDRSGGTYSNMTQGIFVPVALSGQTNAPPAANDMAIYIPEDTATNLVFDVSDPNGDDYFCGIVAHPTNGMLGGWSTSTVYRADSNYFGTDSFTYTAYDWISDSSVATVTIHIAAVNDPPVTETQHVWAVVDIERPIELTAWDVEDDPLTLMIVSNPVHGDLLGTPTNLSYLSDPGYDGPDAFTYVANDGQTDGNTSVVSITVLPLRDPDAPAETTNSLKYLYYEGAWSMLPDFTSMTPVKAGAIADFNLSPKEADKKFAFKYTGYVQVPTNGQYEFFTTSRDGSKLYIGTREVVNNDGRHVAQERSGIAGLKTGKHSITVTFFTLETFWELEVSYAGPGIATQEIPASVLFRDANGLPVASNSTVVTPEDTVTNIVLRGSDPEEDPLAYTVLEQPEHGTLSGAAPDLTYTPSNNFHGSDSFTFRVNDGEFDSDPATVSVTVNQVNDTPVVFDAHVSAPDARPTRVRLAAMDVDGDALTYSIVSLPSHGSLSGTGAIRVFTPTNGYSGDDTFTFRVTDGPATSNVATVYVDVEEAGWPLYECVAWGRNANGQLGDGTTEQRESPVPVLGIGRAIRVAAGGFHSLVLKPDGTVRAWGMNTDGQLGDGTTNEHLTAVRVGGIGNVIEIAAGGGHSLALKTDGTVWAWGRNSNGQLGDGATNDVWSPTQVAGLSNICAISAGGSHSMAAGSGGRVHTWGANTKGQLGDSTFVQRETPVVVPGPTNAFDVEAGSEHSLALCSDGRVWAWGKNDNGELGRGTIVGWSPNAEQVVGIQNVDRIAAGDQHSLAGDREGSAWEWGRVYDALGSMSGNGNPRRLQSLAGIRDVQAGYLCSYVVDTNGSVQAWGWNGFGQLGDGSTDERKTPVPALDTSGFEGASVTMVHGLAVRRLKDEDHDGMPDDWEKARFPEGTNAAPEGHSDGDKLTNREELYAGTDPTNELSVLEMLAPEMLSNGWFVVRWSSVSNRLYGVDRSTNLLDGFERLQSDIPGAPPTNVYTDEVDNVMLLQYRTVVEP